MDLALKIGLIAGEVLLIAFCLWIMFRLFRKNLPGDDIPGSRIQRWDHWH